jgi:glycosyltransferase involved in cell wall biosynthesis
LRVTLITGEYPPMRGGVADYTYLLASGLQRAGVEVSVLTSVRAAGGSTNGVRVYPVVKGWGRSVWRDIAEYVEREQPDVLHLQYQTGAFDMQLGVIFLPLVHRWRRPHRPLVVTFHDLKEPYLLPKLGPLRHLATIGLAAAADALVVTNAEDYARVAAGHHDGRARWTWGGRRLRAIPIGSNIPAPVDGYERDVWRQRFGARPDDLVLAYFGFLGPGKGVETLVGSFETLVQRGRPVRLLMIGATAGDSGHPERRDENAIRERLDDPRVRGRVTWTGFLQASDVAASLKAADLGCLPFREGASLRHGTFVAAMVHGLPTVTTLGPVRSRPSPFPSLISGENVWLVPPNDEQALSDAVERLIDDSALRQRLATGARQLADHFRWDAIAMQTLRLYQELDRERTA